MGAEVNGKLIHAGEQEPRKLEFDGNKEKTAAAAPKQDAAAAANPVSDEEKGVTNT